MELINVYGRRNPDGEDYDIFYPFTREANPRVTYESTFVETPAGNGRTLLLPLVNVGMEIRF